MRKRIAWIGGLLAALALLPVGLIVAGRAQLHDGNIPQRSELVPAQPQLRVMTFFPHPDDEVSVAGTLIGLRKRGHEVHLVYLTRGEKGTVSGIIDPATLARIRTAEVGRAAAAIGATSVRFLDFADSGLTVAGLDRIEASAAQVVGRIRPDVVITYDSKVGLYGHEDHRLSGLAMERMFTAWAGTPGFTPRHLFQVTLSPKQIALALKISATFKNRYPRTPGAGLPRPDFSIPTQPHYAQVMAVTDAHASQRRMLDEFRPLNGRVPDAITSRIFDREYFREVGPATQNGGIH